MPVKTSPLTAAGGAADFIRAETPPNVRVHKRRARYSDRRPAEAMQSDDSPGVRERPHAGTASQCLSRPLYSVHTMCLTMRASIRSIQFSSRWDVQSPPTGCAQSFSLSRQRADVSRSPSTKTILLTARMSTAVRHMLGGFTWLGSIRPGRR